MLGTVYLYDHEIGHTINGSSVPFNTHAHCESVEVSTMPLEVTINTHSESFYSSRPVVPSNTSIFRTSYGGKFHEGLRTRTALNTTMASHKEIDPQSIASNLLMIMIFFLSYPYLSISCVSEIVMHLLYGAKN